jgi:hypothetical protein
VVEETNPLLEGIIDVMSADLVLTEEIDENITSQL